MYHPYISSKLAEDHYKTLLEEANRERSLLNLPSYSRSRRKLWISLATSTPVVLLVLWLAVFG